MALTAAEEAELAQLEMEFAQPSQGNLSPQEEAELQALEMEFGSAPTQAPAEDSINQQINRYLAEHIPASVFEAMAAVNRGVTSTVDLPIHATNWLAEKLGGAPLLTTTEMLSPATTGNFMEDGAAKRAVRTIGEFTGGAATGGALFRAGAGAIPKGPPAPMGQQSLMAELLRAGSSTTPRADAAAGAVTGAGAFAGGEAAEAIGGDDARLYGELIGSLTPAGLAASRGAISKLAKGGITPEAERLLEQGVRLTPGMAREGGVATAVEKAAANIPGLRAPIRRLQDQAMADQNLLMLKKTAPSGAKITAPGGEGFGQIQKAYNDAYTDAWKKVTPESVDIDGAQRKIAELISEELSYLADDTFKQAERITQNTIAELNRFKASGKTEILERLDDRLRAIDTGNDGLAATYIENLRRTIKTGMGKAGSDLRQLDRKYAEYKVVERAGGNYLQSLEADSVFTPRQQMSAVKASNDQRALSAQRGLGQEDANLSQKTLQRVMEGRRETGLISDVGSWRQLVDSLAQAPIAGATAIPGRMLFNESMRRALTGTSPSPTRRQEALARALRAAGYGGAASED